LKRINVLSPETTNKIAAGEVVERPSSVVKELVENSIDADSENITIEVVDGGQKNIKITDDGTGIHPDDVEDAFKPHATSKIANIEDIYKISTMGFRGEALSSIASISNIILKSRRDGFDFGKEIAVEGGKIESINEIGCSRGTVMEVRSLFFNVPARQKFLKSSQRETALISDIIMRLALANSNISFKFFKNGKKSFVTYGTDNLSETIRCLYGKEVYNNIISFEKHSDIASVHGYIGNAEISRGSRNRQSIFVNKRLIKSKMITAAVENAFKSFLTINKFPFFVLFIDIYPEYIDVNVHPTKSEIKFQRDRSIFKLVFDAVHEALRNSFSDTFNISFEEEEFLPKVPSKVNADSSEEIAVSNNKVGYGNKIDDEYNSKIQSEIVGTKITQIPIDLKPTHSQKENNILNNDEKYSKIDYNTSYKKEFVKEDAAKITDDLTENKEIYENNEAKTYKFQELRVIGQFNKTYIIAEANKELYLIDQHAAHEKVLFEKFRKEIACRKVVSQILLTPVVKELMPEDFIYFIENKDIFKDAGFNIEVFGDNTISIREVPVILGKPDIKNFFMEILDDLKDMGSGKAADVKYNAIATMACRAAVKAHDELSEEEMKYLLNDLRYIDEPFTCPHGRPTIIKFTLGELERKFKRIQ
jgi:DNA mismatch repair protein MutL